MFKKTINKKIDEFSKIFLKNKKIKKGSDGPIKGKTLARTSADLVKAINKKNSLGELFKKKKKDFEQTSISKIFKDSTSKIKIKKEVKEETIKSIIIRIIVAVLIIYLAVDMVIKDTTIEKTDNKNEVIVKDKEKKIRVIKPNSITPLKNKVISDDLFKITEKLKENEIESIDLKEKPVEKKDYSIDTHSSLSENILNAIKSYTNDQRRNKKNEKERKRNQIISDYMKKDIFEFIPDYTLGGKGLVYNCISKHFSCVNEEQFEKCSKVKRYSEKYEFKNPCETVSIYKTVHDCDKAIYFWINYKNRGVTCN